MNTDDPFDEALESVVEGQSPKGQAQGLTEEERRLLQVAQMIRGAGDARPQPEFSEGLARRLQPRPDQISRRTAVISGLSALAAGLAVGFGVEHGLDQPSQEHYSTAEADLWEPTVAGSMSPRFTRSLRGP